MEYRIGYDQNGVKKEGWLPSPLFLPPPILAPLLKTKRRKKKEKRTVVMKQRSRKAVGLFDDYEIF